MKNRILLSLIILFVALGQVWGAGSREPAATADDPITLRVWGGVPEENGPAELIANFEAANPDIRVEYTRFVNDDSGNLRLDTALIAGRQVDVYFTYSSPQIVRRAQTGNALALNELAAADGFDFEENFGDVSFARIDDNVYAIPTAAGSQFFMANMDMLEAAGITEIPTSWTVDEFMDVARRLSSGTGQDRVYGVMFPNWPQMWLLGANVALGPNAWLNDDQTEANFDHPLFAEWIETRRTMQFDDQSEVPYLDVVAQNLSDATEYLTGQVAMIYTGGWRIRNINDPEQTPDFRTTFLPMPTMVDGQDRLYNEGSLGDWAMIARDTPHADAAWRFIRYFATDGTEPMVRRAGKIPAWTGFPADPVLEMVLGENPEERFDVEAYQRVVLDPPLFSYQPTTDLARGIYNEMRDVLREEVELLLIGRQDMDRTIEQLNSRTNTLIRAAR